MAIPADAQWDWKVVKVEGGFHLCSRRGYRLDRIRAKGHISQDPFDYLFESVDDIRELAQRKANGTSCNKVRILMLDGTIETIASELVGKPTFWGL